MPTKAEMEEAFAKKEAEFEARLKEQEKELEELRKSQEVTFNEKDAVNTETERANEPPSSNAGEEFNIRADDYVEIISLCPNTLYLSVSASDDTPTVFEEIGESRWVLYSDLVKYVSRHRNFAKNGTFYIVDQSIVKRLRLLDDYKKILDNKELQKLMSSDSDTAIRLFKSANKTQQEYIADMFIQKILKEEKVDMNLVYQMGKILGMDIAKEAEDAQEFKQLLLR